MAGRPNILMIMTDNQPADMLGCYGNDEVLTRGSATPSA